MTMNECEKLLAAMIAIYSRHFLRPDESIRSMRNGWYLVMQDYSYQEASVGLKWYARSDTKGFPPVPGQIIDNIHKAREAAGDDYLSEAEAWDLCYKAICDSNYHSEERFDALPSIVREAVGSPGALRQMAVEENVNVTKSVFLSTYREAVRRRRTEGTAPKDIQRLMRDKNRRSVRGDETGKRSGHLLVNGKELPICYGKDGWDIADISEVVAT